MKIQISDLSVVLIAVVAVSGLILTAGIVA